MPKSNNQAEIKVEEISIADLLQDDRNANRHTERGDELLVKSIGELGLGRSVLVDAKGKLIAGNGVQKQALAAGKSKALIVDVDGDTLLVARRKDLDLDDKNDPRARQMALVDNASALTGIDFDLSVADGIGEDWGFDVADWGVEMPGEAIDYSEKNKEVDVDRFEDKCTLVLEYTLEEFHTVKTALLKIAATPEQAVWQLLELKNE